MQTKTPIADYILAAPERERPIRARYADRSKRPSPIQQVAEWPDVLTYWLCDDGNVWSCKQRVETNCGPLPEFVARFRAGQFRGTLIESTVRA